LWTTLESESKMFIVLLVLILLAILFPGLMRFMFIAFLLCGALLISQAYAVEWPEGYTPPAGYDTSAPAQSQQKDQAAAAERARNELDVAIERAKNAPPASEPVAVPYPWANITIAREQAFAISAQRCAGFKGRYSALGLDGEFNVCQHREYHQILQQWSNDSLD
jgi:hypothetical protein